MRLLNTLTGQFVWIVDPSTVRYAILSHTWQSAEKGGDQSYADVRELQTATGYTSTRLLDRIRGQPSRQLSVLSHAALSDKIKGFCQIAREADTSFSAELSEAINSMYQWYRLADICYVYLADVPDNDKPAEQNSAFRKSRWHKRGWTLQELIAPTRRVAFLTRTWRSLGTKMGLASTLEEITGIDFAILTGTAELGSVSVARRMSWAAARKTTRVEDEAYCLMGLFGVHMATIYSEGHNAFLRLQEEIIRTIPDQSIFAWGRSYMVLYDLPDNRLFVAPPDQPRLHLEASPHSLGLLALSPQDFEFASDIATLPLQEFASLLGEESDFKPPTLHCLFTPQGVALHLLLLDLSAELPQIRKFLSKVHKGSSYWTRSYHGDFRSLALLRCQDEHGSLVALSLSELPQVVPARVQEPLVIASHMPRSQPDHLHTRSRIIRLGKSTLATIRAQPSGPGWNAREVYIRRHNAGASYHNDTSSMMWRHGSFGNAVTAYIADQFVDDMSTLGFQTSPLRYSYTMTDNNQTFTASTNIHSSTCTSDDTHNGCEDIKVGVILTNRVVAKAYRWEPPYIEHARPFLG